MLQILFETALYIVKTDTRLTTYFPGQRESAGTGKVNPIWILMKPEIWHQLDHIQMIYTLLQTDNHASTSSLIS